MARKMQKCIPLPVAKTCLPADKFFETSQIKL
jgi:hypothetical protein